ncbi:MAG: glycine cleavage system protein GcvH [Bacteroidales bacterium]
MNIPEELMYSKDHEWIRFEGNSCVVGITEFAQNELGDIVFVEVDTVDEELEAGETFGTIEAVKTVSDLMMPVSGKITEFNTNLEDEPELINKDPYAEGWIIKIEAGDNPDKSHLISADEYKALIEA